MRSAHHTLVAVAAASLAAAAIASAAPPGRATNTSAVVQELLSRSLSGGAPNAPATDPVFSWDGRAARYVAYTSAATDISAATNGRRNVFLVTRTGSGGAWHAGSTTLASVAANGQPADGDSFSPALDGYSQADNPRGPSCVAFVSEASNLIPGDGNGQADVFVRSIGSGTLARIASPPGKPASEVGVSGDCRAIVFIAGGSVYAVHGGSAPRKIAGGGGASAPRSTLNGRGLSYAKGGSIYAGSISGKVHKVASGAHPEPDAGAPSSPGKGRVRFVSYERGGTVYYRKVGGFNRRIGAGTGAHPSSGGSAVSFGAGPFAYLYAVSDDFGKKAPQGFCPAGAGDVTRTYPSARGNDLAFACSGGAIYVSFVGGQ